MEKNFLQFDQPEGWLVLIFLAAIGFTWFLYSIRNPAWTRTQNWILSGIRFVAIFFLLILILEPLINHTIIRTDKPVLAVAVDNSQSVFARSQDSTEIQNAIQNIQNELSGTEIEVEYFDLDDIDSSSFNAATTNLSLLQQRVNNTMEGRNWVATLMFSDGIFNEGSSPIYYPTPVPQFTIGLGDTIPPRDINISRVLYNRVTFKGNETPIRVEVTSNGFEGQQIPFYLMERGNIIDQQTVSLNNPVHEFEFIIKSEEEGLRQLEIVTANHQDDFIKENNSSTVFMEVIDGRQQVLIVAESPHPDIKAIRSALSSTDNYEVDLFIPAIDQQQPTKIYDVVIYHGAFSRQVNYVPKENPGTWHILSQRSALGRMNRNLPFLNIRRRGSQVDNVSPSLNASFSKFNLQESNLHFDEFPPMDIPFGDYQLSGPTEVLLHQQVGSITTKKPLFVFFDDGSQKGAVLAGQNIWKWKLQEFAITGSAKMFNELITKTTQYLSVKNDKKQFRFASRGNKFSNLRPILFDSEVYNDIYERIYGNKISLSITDSDGNQQNYSFVDSEYNSSFKIPSLSHGVYSYSAEVSIGNRTLADRGQFLVEEVNREYLNLTADHNVLRTLATRTGGAFWHFDNWDAAVNSIRSQDFKSVIKESESFFPLIQSRWMLLIILVLFSSEWALRKYLGGY